MQTLIEITKQVFATLIAIIALCVAVVQFNMPAEVLALSAFAPFVGLGFSTALDKLTSA